MSSKKAIIIIPTYNERENIAKLIPVLLEIFTAIKQWQMEILVVDDSSPDGTADVVAAIAKKDPLVHLFVNTVKAGLGHAYLVGMHEAVTHYQADVVFEMDADFSHDPSKIPAFLDAIDQGADMVVGSRYIPGGSIPQDWGWNRKFLSVVGNWVNKIILFDFSVNDWTTGYRAIKKEVFLAVSPEMGDERFAGYTFQIGFLHKALRKKFRIKEVPIQFTDRVVGESKLGTDYIVNALMYLLTERAKEILASHLFKFAVVGGIGFVINLVALAVLSAPAVGIEAGNASAIGAEIAIVSNFLFNNFWTFSERKVSTLGGILKKFVQFNIASLGAVIIQKVVVGLGTQYTSASYKFLWFVLAVGIGMVLNYIIYSKVIWKKTK